MIREELSRLVTVEERHRRLVARLLLALGATVVVFVVGTVLIWLFEGGRRGGDIHGVGDAAFFTGVQLLTLGLLAELQARTYHESQDKPTYVIREIRESAPLPSAAREYHRA